MISLELLRILALLSFWLTSKHGLRILSPFPCPANMNIFLEVKHFYTSNEIGLEFSCLRSLNLEQLVLPVFTTVLNFLYSSSKSELAPTTISPWSDIFGSSKNLEFYDVFSNLSRTLLTLIFSNVEKPSMGKFAMRGSIQRSSFWISFKIGLICEKICSSIYSHLS